MKTLNPCPFCGAQPKNPEREGGGDERNGYNFVVVIRCQCGVSMQRHSHRNKQGWCDDSGQAESEVIKAWNRRAMLADKEKQQAEPVAWMESPYGAIRANPAYKIKFPSQLLHWQIPLFIAPQQQAEPVAWLRVIDEAMVVHHLGVADPTDDYETAKRKMNTLLCMAQDIGADFAKQAEPVQSAARVDAYDMIDRFLRNNLRDDDYAEYSAALDSLYTAPPPQQQAEQVQDLIPPDSLFVCDQMGAHVTRVRLAQQAEPVHPSGFAYRYPDGVRFNNGCEVNGCLPSEVIPYYLGKAPPKAEPVQRTPATGAAPCVPSPSFQMTTQAEPVQPDEPLSMSMFASKADYERAKQQAERVALRALIADDAFASSFQTTAQYRSALLKATKGGGNG